MQDCVYVDAALPVRQGDVLKRVRGDGPATLAIVITADCDIANEKFGDAGLACVNRPGFELTPRSWTVAIPPTRRCFSAGIPPG